jgi:hypothetical protein
VKTKAVEKIMALRLKTSIQGQKLYLMLDSQRTQDNKEEEED